MTDFNVPDLLAKEVPEQQISIIKALAKESSQFKYEGIEILRAPFQVWLTRRNVPIIDRRQSIDCRLWQETEGNYKPPQKGLKTKYVIAYFSTHLELNAESKEILKKVAKTFPQQPFAVGLIDKEYHKHKNLESLAQNASTAPLVDKLHPRKKYHAPQSTKPHLALFFSVYAIGDTKIEIRQEPPARTYDK